MSDFNTDETDLNTDALTRVNNKQLRTSKSNFFELASKTQIVSIRYSIRFFLWIFVSKYILYLRVLIITSDGRSGPCLPPSTILTPAAPNSRSLRRPPPNSQSLRHPSDDNAGHTTSSVVIGTNCIVARPLTFVHSLTPESGVWINRP